MCSRVPAPSPARLPRIIDRIAETINVLRTDQLAILLVVAVVLIPSSFGRNPDSKQITRISYQFQKKQPAFVAMLSTIAGIDRVKEAHHEAVEQRYLWHEFGVSHLILN